LASADRRTPDLAPEAAAARPRRLVRRIAASIAVLLAVALFLFVTDAGGLRDLIVGRTVEPIDSIAILPLDSRAGGPQPEYFVDGMTRQLIDELASVEGLRVISPASAMKYRTTVKPLAEVARELDVDALVQGSIEKIGDRVRITTEVIVPTSDVRAEPKVHERELRDALSLVQEVGQALVRQTSVPVPAARRPARPVDPEALDAYLNGRLRLGRGSDAEIDMAIGLFERALAEDEAFAPAWAALADAHLMAALRATPTPEARTRARTAGERAVALDDELADAHRVLGQMLFQWERDWSGAERELKRAIELAPGRAEAHAAYGMLLSALGRSDEALAEIWLAAAQDPLASSARLNAGWVSFQARRFDGAIAEFGRAIEIDSSLGLAHAGLAISLVQANRFAEALRAAERAVDADQRPPVLALVAGVYAADGQRTMARRFLSLAVQRVACPLDVAAIHVALGEPGEAYRWLDRGFTERSPCMSFVRTDVRLDRLRADRRFIDMLERMKFPR
jgi:TolB-like protein/Tfp pilus assembly protein PilF